MKFKYVLILVLPVFMIIGCDDDSSTTAATVSCTTLQTQMDSALTAATAGAATAEAATLCQAALTAMTALKDNSCNASAGMMAVDGDTETWPVDAEDVTDMQTACTALSGG